MTTTTTEAPSDGALAVLSGTERARRYRARKRQGLHLVPIELTEAQISALVSHHWLGEGAKANSAAIAQAIKAIIDHTIRNWDKVRGFSSAYRERILQESGTISPYVQRTDLRLRSSDE